MAAKVSTVYHLLDYVKGRVDYICEEEGLSPLLFWLLLRQQADFELLKQQLDE